MKDNKLIAEFMGAKPLVLGGSTEYEMYGVIDCIEDGVNEKHYFIDDEMRFHSSWDWLMPVVEKIEQIHEGVPKQLIHVSLFSTRQEVYQAVVEFIKQHNK
tara:strand:+ start:237 stop:539 length:303 start_codon:yes stop_codon:yes gene_type:complete